MSEIFSYNSAVLFKGSLHQRNVKQTGPSQLLTAVFHQSKSSQVCLDW